MRLILIQVFALVFNFINAFVCMRILELEFLFLLNFFLFCFSFYLCDVVYISQLVEQTMSKSLQTRLHERLQVNKHTIRILFFYVAFFLQYTFFLFVVVFDFLIFNSTQRTHTNSHIKLDQINYFMFIDCLFECEKCRLINVSMLMIWLLF